MDRLAAIRYDLYRIQVLHAWRFYMLELGARHGGVDSFFLCEGGQFMLRALLHITTFA